MQFRVMPETILTFGLIQWGSQCWLPLYLNNITTEVAHYVMLCSFLTSITAIAFTVLVCHEILLICCFSSLFMFGIFVKWSCCVQYLSLCLSSVCLIQVHQGTHRRSEPRLWTLWVDCNFIFISIVISVLPSVFGPPVLPSLCLSSVFLPRCLLLPNSAR